MEEKLAYFTNFCPNCFRFVDNVRLDLGLPCKKCLPDTLSRTEVCAELKKEKRLSGLKSFCESGERVAEFEGFFYKLLGSYPWSLQLTWAKRVFLKKSFAIQAPTGVGKTTFGLAMAAFLNGRSYLIFPTRLLVQQAYERLKGFAPDKKILAYTGKKSEKKAVEEGNYDILITTHLFMYKNIEMLKGAGFKFIFVDDVDSILKTPKNVDNLFYLMGFEERHLKLALKEQRTEKEERFLERLREKIDSVLVVSSATLKPRTRRINLFRSLLGFDVQQSVSTIREVFDFYHLCSHWDEVKEKAVDIIKRVGRGCFAFVPIDRGKSGVEEVVEYLNAKGISAVSYEDFAKFEDDFAEGRVEVAVGIAISTNPLVRGVDLPFAVRYALFLDVPKHIFPLKITLNPPQLFSLLRMLVLVVEEESEKIFSYMEYLKRYLTLREEQLDRYPRIKERVEEIADYLSGLLAREDVRRKIIESDEVSIVEKDGEEYVVLGDAVSYIQASGRTSRLVAGGLTKGLSVILALDRKALNSLLRRVRYYLPTETQIKELKDFSVLEEIKRELDESRNRERLVKGDRKELLKSALVVVESPNKAKTISGFFGKPQRRWFSNMVSYEINTGRLHLVIAASVGHVCDLVLEGGIFGVRRERDGFYPVYSTIKKCSCGQQTVAYLCPKCGSRVTYDKLDVIKALRELAFEVNEVFIATDPDAEGEKIAWDLFLALNPVSGRVKRMEFHEVTPFAFKEALENLHDIDRLRVKAQIVRRIADRWVGFTFSQKVQEAFRNRRLSAGRVQTPVLGWVIEREEKSREKKAQIIFKIGDALFKWELEEIDKAKLIFERLKGASWRIKERKEDEISPQPPYTTSDLLRDAADRLGFSAELTMRLAQELFELGHITYHRTDSTRVSPVGLAIAREFIEKNFPGYYRGRTWGAGGAHECIRPTRVITPKQFATMINAGEVEVDKRCANLYELIFWRFIASQMKEAVVEKALVEVVVDDLLFSDEVVTKVVFDGFTRIFPLKVYRLEENSKLEPVEFKLVPRVWPFTEGELIDEMKRRGLGRPSTYAKIVQTLFERKYVVRRGKFLHPTRLGVRVFNYLKQFEPYTSEEFTRMLEEKMDLVEKGDVNHQEVLRELSSVTRYAGA
ncbi:MAG: reverse gyrase [Deferribacteres bacterium]|nr:reverse gyrase [Deferribacteres bacterium]